MRGSTSTGVAKHFAPRKASFGNRIMPMPSFNSVLLCIIAAALCFNAWSQSQMLMKLESAIDMQSNSIMKHEKAIDMHEKAIDMLAAKLVPEREPSSDVDVAHALASRPPAMAAATVDVPAAEDEAVAEKVADDAPNEHDGAVTTEGPRRLSEADCSCLGTRDWTASAFGSTPMCELDVGNAYVYMPECQLYQLISAVASNTASLNSLTTTVDAHTTALSCASGGRRLETDEPPAASAKEVLDKYLADRPDIAEKINAEIRAGFEEHGQDFGLPAHA